MKKKIVTLFSLIASFSMVAIAAICVSSSKEFDLFNKQAKHVSAEECLHGHVEHYNASETSIEHWACCDCHQAWADSAKTILLSSDTYTQRDKIDFGSKYFHVAVHTNDWVWDANPTVVYDNDFDFAYSIDVSGSDMLFFESNDITTELAAGMSWAVKVYNNTNQTIDAVPVSREWANSEPGVSLEPGQNAYVFGSASLWNSQSKKGAAIRITGSLFDGEVIVSEIQLLSSSVIANYYSTVALVPSWNYYPATISYVGGTFSINNSITFAENTTQLFFESKDTATELGDGLYYMVQVENHTNKDLYVTPVGREWGTSEGTFTVGVGQKAIVYATDDLWNSQTKKGAAIRFTATDSGTFEGTIIASNPVIVENIPSPSYFDAIEPNSLACNLMYDKEYGYCYTFDGTKANNLYIAGLAEIDTQYYQGINIYVYNEGAATNGAIWSEDWGEGQYQGFAFAANSWTTLNIRADVWNGNRGSCKIGFYDGLPFGGEVRIALNMTLVAK